jgi:hypothetical protein
LICTGETYKKAVKMTFPKGLVRAAAALNMSSARS